MTQERNLVPKVLIIGGKEIDLEVIKRSGKPAIFEAKRQRIPVPIYVEVTENSIYIADRPKDQSMYSTYNFYAAIVPESVVGKFAYWDIHTRDRNGEYLTEFPRGRELVNAAFAFLDIADSVPCIAQKWNKGEDNHIKYIHARNSGLSEADSVKLSWDFQFIPQEFSRIQVLGDMMAGSGVRNEQLGVRVFFRKP